MFSAVVFPAVELRAEGEGMTALAKADSIKAPEFTGEVVVVLYPHNRTQNHTKLIYGEHIPSLSFDELKNLKLRLCRWHR